MATSRRKQTFSPAQSNRGTRPGAGPAANTGRTNTAKRISCRSCATRRDLDPAVIQEMGVVRRGARVGAGRPDLNPDRHAP
jgi:hypothetical protein